MIIYLAGYIMETVTIPSVHTCVSYSPPKNI